MAEDRLNGLCILSVQREQVNLEKDKFIEITLTQFGREYPHRLQFPFNKKERFIKLN